MLIYIVNSYSLFVYIIKLYIKTNINTMKMQALLMALTMFTSRICAYMIPSIVAHTIRPIMQQYNKESASCIFTCYKFWRSYLPTIIARISRARTGTQSTLDLLNNYFNGVFFAFSSQRRRYKSYSSNILY